MTRREFTLVCLGGMAAAGLAGIPVGAAADASQQRQSPVTYDAGAAGKLHVAFLLYEGLTSLDLIGPAAVLANAGFDVDYVWRDKHPVRSESGADRQLALVPTATFVDVSRTDILCVPGTSNPYVQITQPDIVEWVAEVGRKAAWVTSVCTGSFILGAAGLLKGYRATSHWTVVDELAWFGAAPVRERVVRDRNRVTGAGVTSGIDFGLELLSLIRGEEAARAQQLLLEYDPHPPFNSGSPATASPELVAAVQKRYAARLATVAPDARKTLEDAARRLGVPAVR